ncbi:MAG TPA: sulfocyanin-like copper-binding protein, partial [Gemmatimonadaceae bacterium]|nr:sulfocyanin-like copper-binding protein [Gemmatimonadaceae bacterium]
VGTGADPTAANRAAAQRAESLAAAARHDSAASLAAIRRDSIRADSVKRAAATRVAVRDTTARARRDSSATTSHTTTTVARTTGTTGTTHAPAAPTGPVHVNEFLTYDASVRTASVQLIAGYNGLNESLNYNGAMRGTRALAIPLGWRVHVTVSNRDTDLQHSAIVVREVLPPPLELTTPAFPGAALARLDEGLHDDETGTFDFVASRAGRYMLACGVPGHAQSGMWIRLIVAPGLTVPAYR